MASRYSPNARRGARILLVDDNRSGLTARQSVLEELGYITEGLADPEEAIAACAAREYDLVVTDYRLPGMNGVELIEALRRRNSAVPVILISGYVDVLGLTEKTTGANAVIMKSCNEVQHLLRAVGRLLNAPPKRKPAAEKARRAQPAASKSQAAG
jgi:CheY-like chemotaxis protein